MEAQSKSGPERTARASARTRAAIWNAVTYVAAIGAGAGAALAIPAEPLWLQVTVANGVATLVTFASSMALRTSSMFDLYWSVMPMALVVALAAAPAAEGTSLARRVLLGAVVWIWGARLSHNWWRGYPGLPHEDYRYVDIRAKTGRLYPLASLFGIHAFPAGLIQLGSLSLLVAYRSTRMPFGLFDVAGAAVSLGGVWLEGAADNQLRRFRLEAKNHAKLMDQGVWAWSRHPNYCGELMFWWGLAIAAYGADPAAIVGAPYVLLGPVSMTLLFVFISVPMADKRSLLRRPEYEAYMRRTSAILPWPPGS